ncbi:MAG: recombination protein RecR [Ardenticatenales bacterium]|jgi:recombination protein RecR|nr:recombination protein RecR [Ardenticatenales bacterium]
MSFKAVPEPVTRLVEEFSKLPGIGPKTASRLVYHLLKAADERSLDLATALQELKARTRFCDTCFNITEEQPCPICRDPDRERRLICVVEAPLDVLAIEKTAVYHGQYHVLHGAISPIEGVGPDDLRITELYDRIRRGDVREIIIATNPTLEGEATAMYVQRQLAAHVPTISRLARGLPVGGDLEYVDQVTLARALEGRSAM